MTNIQKAPKSLKKLAKSDKAPDCHDLTSVDNLLRQMRWGLGYDPLVELVSLARDTGTSNSEKIKIATELLQYTHPKLKAISGDANQGEVINVSISYPDKDDAIQMQDSLSLEYMSENISDSYKLESYRF